MNGGKRALTFNILGMIFCIVPVTLATLEHFPVWVGGGTETTVSAFSLILLCLCAIPLRKYITEYFKSPSAWVMWLTIFVLLTLFRNITDSLIEISFIAFPTNFIGAVMFRIAKKAKKKSEEDA